MAKNSFNIIKDKVDVCLIEAWHHDGNVVYKLAEFYYKRYVRYGEESRGELSDFVLALYWLSKARGEEFCIAYIWIVRLIDAYHSTCCNDRGYRHSIIEHFKKFNKQLYSSICDDEIIINEDTDFDKINLAQLFLLNDGIFTVEYLNHIRKDYIVKASEHGYAYNDFHDDVVKDEDEECEENTNPHDLDYLFVMRHFVDNVFTNRYENVGVVQDFKNSMLEQINNFEDGHPCDKKYYFWFSNEWDTGNETLEVNLRGNELSFVKYGYMRSEYGGDSYTNFQCRVFTNGKIETDIGLDEFVEKVDGFIDDSSKLTIVEPFSYDEANDDLNN